jgi:hypothetical protein
MTEAETSPEPCKSTQPHQRKDSDSNARYTAAANLKLSIPTHNRFQSLATPEDTTKRPREEEENESEQSTHRKQKKKEESRPNPTNQQQKTTDPRNQQKKDPFKPPAIVITDVTNFATLHQQLIKLTGGRFTTSCRGRSIQVETTRFDDYDAIKENLIKNNINGHTYQPEKEKGIKVVIKGIHPHIQDSEIKEDLEREGFTPLSIYRMKNSTTNRPIPIVAVELQKDKKNKEIYDLTTLLYHKVTVEAQHKPKIAICMKCSSYDHTQRHCFESLKCGRCGGKHDFKTCTNQLCCPKCGDAHPISYRGCPEYLRIEDERTTRKIQRRDAGQNPNQFKNTPTPQPQAQQNPWFKKHQAKTPQPKEEIPSTSTAPSYIDDIIKQIITWITNKIKEYLPQIITIFSQSFQK